MLELSSPQGARGSTGRTKRLETESLLRRGRGDDDLDDAFAFSEAPEDEMSDDPNYDAVAS